MQSLILSIFFISIANKKGLFAIENLCFCVFLLFRDFYRIQKRICCIIVRIKINLLIDMSCMYFRFPFYHTSLLSKETSFFCESITISAISSWWYFILLLLDTTVMVSLWLEELVWFWEAKAVPVPLKFFCTSVVHIVCSIFNDLHFGSI